MSSYVVLITGSNRGIGLGLVHKYALRPYHVVIATVRDPTSASSKALGSVPTGVGSKVIIVKIDSSITQDAEDAVKIVREEYAIDHIDLVIANAATATFYGPALNTPIEGFRDHLFINTVAVLALVKATWPLLKLSASPKFVPISSTVGSIGDMEKWPMNATAYGSSKAALNWVTKGLHVENPGLIAFPIHPGWVQTDMGNAGAVANGLKEAPTTVKESVDGIVSKIDNATREKTSGTFVSYDGEHVNW